MLYLQCPGIAIYIVEEKSIDTTLFTYFVIENYFITFFVFFKATIGHLNKNNISLKGYFTI